MNTGLRIIIESRAAARNSMKLETYATLSDNSLAKTMPLFILFLLQSQTNHSEQKRSEVQVKHNYSLLFNNFHLV